MRVVTRSVEEFLANISKEIASLPEKDAGPWNVIHRGLVFQEYYDKPPKTETKHQGRFEILFHVSAVISASGSEYILEGFEDCGVDFRDSEPDLKGTERAQRLQQQLVRFCLENKLSLRPGMVTY